MHGHMDVLSRCTVTWTSNKLEQNTIFCDMPQTWYGHFKLEYNIVFSDTSQSMYSHCKLGHITFCISSDKNLTNSCDFEFNICGSEHHAL